MSKSFTVERRFHLRRGRHSRKHLGQGEISVSPQRRIPRVSRLMALAIRFNQLIGAGAVADQSELARLGRVSRARLTQIMNLLNLAPDIQEDVLNLPSAKRARNTISERQLRPISAEPDWQIQRGLWNALEIISSQ